MTLDGEYDLIRVILDVKNDDNTNSTGYGFQINGDTGENYAFQRSDGSTATGNTLWDCGFADNGGTIVGAFDISGRFAGKATIANSTPTPGFLAGGLLSGFNGNVTSPTTTVTFVSGSTRTYSGNIRIYGLDIQ